MPTNEIPEETPLHKVYQNEFPQVLGAQTTRDIEDPEDPWIGTSFTKPSETTSTSRLHPRRLNKTSRRQVFGLRSLTEEQYSTPNSDRFDYELKYPRDPFGEELGENARIWLTYLDEAGSYDHDKVEGWKDTIDVLLVFTGLFSAIVSTFVAQSSQSLQQDFTQVSASLLFEMVQLQRAQINGSTSSNVPTSPLTPNSPFKPSANSSLVNGLWITSLTISLSTALFAVLTKQWLHHYVSPLSGSAREQAKARHFRFQGLETWKVATIIDLLPSFLHLSLGLFLIGLVIFTVPLDIRIARVVIILTGSTYTLYFLSLLLPIWYPHCPYTTPLTIYLPYMVLILSIVASPLMIILSFISTVPLSLADKFTSGTLSKYSGGILYTFRRPFRRLALLLSLVLPRIANSVRQYSLLYLQSLKSSVFGKDLHEFTNWRWEKLKKSIEKSVWLDLEAIHWLHTISSNPSIRRIIARSISMPRSKKELDFGSINNILWQSQYNDVLANPSRATHWDETDLEEICHFLYLGIPSNDAWCQYIVHVISTAPVDAQQHIRTHHPELSNLLNILNGDAAAVLLQAFQDNTKLRQVVWHHLLGKAQENPELAAYILASYELPLFGWKIADSSQYPDATPLATGALSRRELDDWSVRYLARCFRSQVKDSEYGSFKASYLLVSTIYRNLISEQPFIADQGLKQESLIEMFRKFAEFVKDSHRKNITSKFLDLFQRDILLVDAFWEDSMTYRSRAYAVGCFKTSWSLYMKETGNLNRFFLAGDQELQFTYRWCTKDRPDLSFMGLQLFVNENITKLCDMLRNDPDAEIHFRLCLKCLRGITNRHQIQLRQKYANPNLVNLYKTVSSSDILHSVLYDSLVLVRLWNYFVETFNLSIWDRDILPIIKSKLDFSKLEELYNPMINEATTSHLRHASYKSAYNFGRGLGFADSEFFSRIPVEVARSMNFESAAEMIKTFARELDEEVFELL